MDRTVPDQRSGAADNKLSSEEIQRKKTSFKLDFGAAHESPVSAKKPKQDFRDSILCSPDVGLLALATPDLERFIMQQAYGAATVATTPPGAAAASIVTTPTQILFPRTVTEEQEAYARGFLDALVELHRQQTAASSPLLQVVPDQRVGILLPRASPSEEGQNSLYANLAPTSRLPATGSTILSEPATKRIIPDFSAAVPFSGPRPSTLDLSPAARRSAVLPSFGVKRFPPFIDDSETLDLSPSGRYATRSLVTATAQKPVQSPLSTAPSIPPTSNQLLPPVNVLPASETSRNETLPLRGVLPSTLSDFQPTETTNDQHSQDSSTSHDTSSDVRDQPLPLSDNFSASVLPTRPIDMSVQELAKLERKREKNRHAAQKCRMLKLERISRLQARVDELKQQNETYANSAGTLKDQVSKLRQLIVEHVEGGCQVMMVRTGGSTS